MANYEDLKSRIDQGEVIVLDGAIGTELQAMGVPMDPASWCGPGNYTHPATVRQMHERYIKAGADVITTNTFNTLRPALEASGYSELVREVNVRAVDAAVDGVGRNLNPQATTALLLEEMSAAFAGRSTGRTAGTPQFAGVLRSL